MDVLIRVSVVFLSVWILGKCCLMPTRVPDSLVPYVSQREWDEFLEKQSQQIRNGTGCGSMEVINIAA